MARPRELSQPHWRAQRGENSRSGAHNGQGSAARRPASDDAGQELEAYVGMWLVGLSGRESRRPEGPPRGRDFTRRRPQVLAWSGRLASRAHGPISEDTGAATMVWPSGRSPWPAPASTARTLEVSLVFITTPPATHHDARHMLHHQNTSAVMPASRTCPAICWSRSLATGRRNSQAGGRSRV